MPSQPIRKVAVQPGTKERLREYAWRHRTSMSDVVSMICDNLATNPRYYEAYAAKNGEDDGLTESLTLYVTDDPWIRAKDVLYFARLPLSVGIREGLRALFAAEDIPD